MSSFDGRRSISVGLRNKFHTRLDPATGEHSSVAIFQTMAELPLRRYGLDPVVIDFGQGYDDDNKAIAGSYYVLFELRLFFCPYLTLAALSDFHGTSFHPPRAL